MERERVREGEGNHREMGFCRDHLKNFKGHPSAGLQCQNEIQTGVLFCVTVKRQKVLLWNVKGTSREYTLKAYTSNTSIFHTEQNSFRGGTVKCTSRGYGVLVNV